MSLKRQRNAGAGLTVEKTASLIYTTRDVRIVYGDGIGAEE